MRLRVLALGACFLFVSGCQQHPLTDYRPLDKAGMFSGNIEQLKSLNTSDTEIAQILKLKHARVSDDMCVALVSAAHTAKHPFYSADSVSNLIGASYPESQILDFARADKLDSISGDAVMYRLIGLSNNTVQTLLDRRLQGLPTLSSAAIGRLKNTGLTERQILDHINEGMSDAQAEKEATLREAVRNHSNTGFVATHSRRR